MNIAILAVIASLLVPATPANADTTILCRGFAGCKKLGYGNAGYESQYKKMWWNMYSGHNCTNYAAYRMVKAGMSNVRPWSGGGNAERWGVVLASKTDQRPTVGSIAWWRNRNHVQYVERVISPTEIIVSEDHWGGDFNWARVRKGNGRNWPDGFIHLRDGQVSNLTAPSIPGTPKVGVTVTANRGTWSPTGTFTYQWLANGWPIAGATSLSYTPKAADLGKQLSIRVIGKAAGYAQKQQNSPRSPAVKEGPVQVSAKTTIEGVPKVGGTLTAKPARFSVQPTLTTVRWFADGTYIPGQNSWTIQPGPELEGKRLSAQVTGRRHGYVARSSMSDPTEPVGPESIGVVEPAELVGEPVVGKTLRVQPGKVRARDAQRHVLWLRNGTPIKGATGLTYTPSASEIGHRLAVRVRYKKPGYRNVGWDLTAPHFVRTTPSVTAAGSRHRSVTVSMAASKVPTVKGSVTLKVGNRTATQPLTNGRTVFRQTWLPIGRHTFTLTYSGSNTVVPWTVRRNLTVPGMEK